jgi:hypothetical protein
MEENVKSTVIKLLESNVQDNIYLAINIISDKKEIVEELQEKYFFHKYIKNDMDTKEFVMWAKIAFKN